MSKTSEAVKRLKRLAAEIPDDIEIRMTLQLLEEKENAFTDHSIAMIGASVVDKALEVAIRSRLSPSKEDPNAQSIFSFDRKGPLADLAAKIKMAHAMDIVGPQTRKLR